MKQVKMTKPAFVKEHNELIRILRSNDKAGIKREIKEQSEELSRVKNK